VLVVKLEKILDSKLWDQLVPKMLILLEVVFESSFETLAHVVDMRPVWTCEELLELFRGIFLLAIVVDLPEIYFRIEALPH
jgi:hypothetical protein